MINKPPRYVLCKDHHSFREYLGPMDKQTFQQFRWIRATEIDILNHGAKYSKEEYKGFILPCFKDNPEHDLIWSAHNLVLKAQSAPYGNVWMDEMTEEEDEVDDFVEDPFA